MGRGNKIDFEGGRVTRQDFQWRNRDTNPVITFDLQFVLTAKFAGVKVD